MLARQSAAFDACLLLRKQNLLDDNFRSIYHKRLPAMRNAKLAIVSNKTGQYKMICKPSIWKENQGSAPDKLYGMVFNFIPLQSLSREHRSILLLTRVRLPPIPDFPLFLENDKETTIQTIVFDSTLSVLNHDLDCLSQFTLAVFRDVFHKTFEPITGNFPYWLAPIRPGVVVDRSTILPKDVVDWDILNFVHEQREQKWTQHGP